MDYRFLVEVITLKPRLFRAMIAFNREYAAPVPAELSSLGGTFATLWTRQDFRRSWGPADRQETGYWNFSEESQRLALLDADTLARVGLFFSAAVHAEELAHVIAREQVLALRRELGADVLSYALKRGRYQVGSLRPLLLATDVPGDLAGRVRTLAAASLGIVSSDWPEQLRALAACRLPHVDMSPSSEESSVPQLRREQRRALWFTMKKLLLREVAPEWAPCFD